MIGIKCKVKNEYNNFLYKLLNNISKNQFQWVIVEDEIYNEDSTYLFTKNIYEDKEFQTLIKKDKYYTVFANIQLYDKNEHISDIKNYEDFLKSSCKLIIFVTDNEFIDIYSKDDKILTKIKKNMLENEFEDIQENMENIRKTFSAYTD